MNDIRHIKPKKVYLDQYEAALNVEYIVEVFDSKRGKALHETKQHKIRLKGLKEDTDITTYSKSIIRRSKYIPAKWSTYVEQEIQKLYEKQFSTTNTAGYEETLSPRINCIDQYLDLLYENDEKKRQKIQGLASILHLCKHMENLPKIVQNNALMSALSRIMDEEKNKSIELAFLGSKIFFVISNFREFHFILSHHKIGFFAMEIISLVIRRNSHQSLGKNKQYKQYNESIENASFEIHLPNETEWIRPKKHDHLVICCVRLLRNLAEDADIEAKMVKKSIIKLLTSCLMHKSVDSLLTVLRFLKKLTIFQANAEEMIESNAKTLEKIVWILYSVSDRTILRVGLEILFNLSFLSRCRCKLMHQKGFLNFLSVQLKHSSLRRITLQLLYHMSIEIDSRESFCSTNLIHTFATFCSSINQSYAKILSAILVNLSFDKICADELLHEEALIDNLLKYVQKKQNNLFAKVLRNLSRRTHKIQFDIFSDTESKLTVDSYKMKGYWSFNVPRLLDMTVSCENHDLLLEFIGILQNISVHDFPHGKSWADFIPQFSLCSFIAKLLMPGMAENDIVLEVIILVGRVCVDIQCAWLLNTGRVVATLIELWQESTHDPEISAHLLFVFHRFLHFNDTRHALLDNQHTLDKIIEACQSRNPHVMNMAENCIDLIIELHSISDDSFEEYVKYIVDTRFRIYNRQWIESLQA